MALSGDGKATRGEIAAIAAAVVWVIVVFVTVVYWDWI